MFLRPRRALLLAAGATLATGAATVAIAPLHTAAATTFVVSTTSDLSTANAACTNPCSLRQAVVDANATTGAVTITFSVAGPFDISTSSLVINGAEQLTIQGQANGSTLIHQGASDRIFLVTASRGGTVTFANLILTNGHATSAVTNPGDDGYGGAIDINSATPVTILDSLISANTAQNGGGAIDDNTGSSLTVIGSAISGNTAGAEGGAIDDNTAASLLLINTTITGNTAAAPGGGAIFGVTGSNLTLVNDTITANTSPTTAGMGAVQTAGTATVSNTIVSDNTGANCAGTITDGGNNLEHTTTTCGFATAVQSGDPLLATLTNNGGFAPTMALRPGSAAIGKGSNTVCAAATNAATPGAGGIDARGATRPQAATCDIGAFEVVATTTALAAPAQSTVGNSVTLTATVTAKQNIPGTPTGTVSFFDGTTLLGTATVSGNSATLTTSALKAGNHSLSASFAQTPLFLASAGAAAITVAVPTPSVGAGLPWTPALALVVIGLGLLVRHRRRNS